MTDSSPAAAANNPSGRRTRAAWLACLTATLGAALLAAQTFTPTHMFNDSFQLASVARNLVQGRGIATDILYYDVHYATGTLPAPQTVWPPGMPIAAATLALLGVEIDAAMFLVSLAGFIAVPLLLAALLRRVSAVPAVWLTVALVPVLMVGNLYFTARAGSEPPFIALTLLAALGWMMPGESARERWLRTTTLATGLALAIAFRYAGLFLIIATVFSALLEGLVCRWKSPLKQHAVALALAGGVAAMLLARNVIDAGNFSGGMEARAWASPVEVLRNLAAAVYSLGGFSTRSFWQLAAALLLAGFVGVSLVRGALLAVSGLRAARRGGARQLSSGLRLWVLCVSYPAATLAALTLHGLQRGADILVDRYFYPLAPFVALACALAWIPGALADDTPRGWLRASNTRLLTAATCLAVAALCAGQWRLARHFHDSLLHDATVASVVAGLRDETPERTVRDLIEREASADSPVLSSSAQLVGGLTSRPVLGLAPAVYSARRWTTDEARELIADYGVCWVLLHAVDSEGGAGGGREFFADLRAGRTPVWLRLQLRTTQISVYRVTMRGCDAV